MKAILILNPKAGNAEAAGLLKEAMAGSAEIEILRTGPGRDARALARRHARSADLLIAAGGDGTLHEVVNGLWEAEEPRIETTLAVIPLGTGNDLARTLAIPDDPAIALELASKGAQRRIDLIHVQHDGSTRVAANVCTGGFSGAMNEHLSSDLKRTWGPLAYLLGAVRTLPDLSGYEVQMAFDDEDEHVVAAFNVVVGNGRTAGGGIPAAPQANPEDGLLDVVVVRQGTAGELGALATRLVAGEFLDDELVIFRRARRLRVSASPGMWFTADGELITSGPIEFSIVPQALPVVVGPRYQAEVD